MVDLDTAPSKALPEAELVQNPALGSLLQWRFLLGHEKAGSDKVPLPLLFLVLPIAMHHRTRDALVGTNRASGLRLFVAKFKDEREELLALNDRMLAFKYLSLRSISLGASKGLFKIDTNDGIVFRTRVRGPGLLPASIVPMWNGAEKLGSWAGLHGIAELSHILKVAF